MIQAYITHTDQKLIRIVHCTFRYFNNKEKIRIQEFKKQIANASAKKK